MLQEVWSSQEMPVPMPSFDSLNKALDKKERKALWIFFADAAIVVLLLLGFWAVQPKAGQNKIAKGKNEVPALSPTPETQKSTGNVQHNNAPSEEKNIQQSDIPASTSTAGNPKFIKTPGLVSPTQVNQPKSAEPVNASPDKLAGSLLNGKQFDYTVTNVQLGDVPSPGFKLKLFIPSKAKDLKVLTPLSIGALAGAGYTRFNYGVNDKFREYISNEYVSTVEKSERTVNSIAAQVRFNYAINKKETWFINAGLGLGQRTVQMNYNHKERVIFDDRSAGIAADMFGNYPILADFGGGKTFTYNHKNKFTSIDLPLGIGYKFNYKKLELMPGVEGIFTKTFNYNAGILNTQKMNSVYEWNKNFNAKTQLGYGLNLNMAYPLTGAVKWNIFLQHNRWFTSSLDPAGSLSIKPRFTAISTGLTWRIYR